MYSGIDIGGVGVYDRSMLTIQEQDLFFSCTFVAERGFVSCVSIQRCIFSALHVGPRAYLMPRVCTAAVDVISRERGHVVVSQSTPHLPKNFFLTIYPRSSCKS